MKRIVVWVLVLGVAILATPSGAWADIMGSVHDFSGQGWSGGEICKVCHTPHHADKSLDLAESPLWNHQVTTAAFTLYTSPTMDVTPQQPGTASKLCLSCHDGTVAIDSFDGGTGTSFVSGSTLIGTDLRDDHPIGIEWDHQTVSGCGTGQCHQGLYGGGEIYDHATPFFYSSSGETCENTYSAPCYVECASCHDVHDADGNTSLLRISNDSSALCLICHTDKE